DDDARIALRVAEGEVDAHARGRLALAHGRRSLGTLGDEAEELPRPALALVVLAGLGLPVGVVGPVFAIAQVLAGGRLGRGPRCGGVASEAARENGGTDGAQGPMRKTEGSTSTHWDPLSKWGTGARYQRSDRWGE